MSFKELSPYKKQVSPACNVCMRHIKASVWAEESLSGNRTETVLNGLSHQRVASTAGEKVTYFGQGVINMNARSQAHTQSVIGIHTHANANTDGA